MSSCLLLKVILNFRKARSNLIAGHFVAFDAHSEGIILASTRAKANLILFCASQEAHGIEGEFKLWRHANKARTDHLFDTLPRELQREELITLIRQGVVVAAWLDVASIIQGPVLFLQIKLNPIVKARNLAIFDFAHKNVLWQKQKVESRCKQETTKIFFRMLKKDVATLSSVEARQITCEYYLAQNT